MLAYTVEAVRFKPERANTAENKEKHKQFVEKLIAYQGRNIPIVFMNERNLNIYIPRS